MTENEIIKALECCKKLISGCNNCPYYNNDDCQYELLVNSLDLINRQKAENESLKVDLAKCSIRLDNLYETADEIKSEAIKEFAKRLKNFKIKPDYPWDDYFVTESAIDNLVKEVTEVSE